MPTSRTGCSAFPPALLFWSGVALIPFVVMLAMIVRAGRAPGGLIVTIIAHQLRLGCGKPVRGFRARLRAERCWARIFVVAQAATVAIFAELQIIGLRRTSATA